MSDAFAYDVFLSHSSKDKRVVHELAKRMKKDGLRVWFDEWEIKPGDSIPAKIEEGLEHSRVLVLCLSANAFGSDWAQLEAGTFRFRDPLNQERRFVPLRLDDAPIKGSLAQFLYINWRPAEREQEYAKLLDACRPPAKPTPMLEPTPVGPTGTTPTKHVAETDEEKKHGDERRWQYIQTHAIRGVEILFILKSPVGFDWFRDLLRDTRLDFSRDEPSFRLGQLLALSSAPNTKELSRDIAKLICSFWEIYQPETGYWFKRITPAPHSFPTVAGFDARVPWPVLRVKGVEKLQDLAMLTDIGVSIPARAYQVGVEEFEVRFLGDTFSFVVSLSEQGLEAMHEMARVQRTVVKDEKPMPIGSHFSGLQLLEMFLGQLLPHKETEKAKSRRGITGLAGPGGKAIYFYPAMPTGFMNSVESNEYSFKIKVPAKVDFTTRVRELEAKLKSVPTDASAYVELAAINSQEGRLQDAMKCLEAAFEKAPPTAELHRMMAQFLAEVGRFEEAFKHLKGAEALAPNDAAVQNGLGICLHELGKDDAALAHFEAAARLEPTTAVYHANHGMWLMKAGRYSEAIASYKRTVKLSPQDAKSTLWLGTLFDYEGNVQEAERYLRLATELAPGSADSHQFLGIHFAKRGQHEEAIVSFQQAIAIQENARLRELLGASLADLGRWQEAETEFRRGVELEPDNSQMVRNLGVTLVNQGRLPEAVQYFERAVAIDPKDHDAQQSLAGLRQLAARN